MVEIERMPVPTYRTNIAALSSLLEGVQLWARNEAIVLTDHADRLDMDIPRIPSVPGLQRLTEHSLCDLHDIVHGLQRLRAHQDSMIRNAAEDWEEDFMLDVRRDLLVGVCNMLKQSKHNQTDYKNRMNNMVKKPKGFGFGGLFGGSHGPEDPLSHDDDDDDDDNL